MIGEIIDAIKGKAGWYDVIEIDGESEPLSFKNNRFHSVQHKQNRGYGVRVNAAGRTGFSHTNDPRSLRDTAERALALAAFGEKEDLILPGPEKKVRTREPYSAEIEGYRTNEGMQQAREAITTLSGEFPGVTVDIGITRSVSSMRLINSSGLECAYRSSHYSAGVSATFVHPDGSKVDIWEGKSTLKPEPIDDCVKTVREKLAHSMKTASCCAGSVPLIVTPKAATRLLGILLSGLNGKSLYKKISPFTGKLGERLFNPRLTVEDDPTLADSPYGYPFDDEGIPARKKTLIDHGTVSCFINDLRYASLLGSDPTGNGSRGYSTLPSPSFSTITVTAGDNPIESLINSIDEGILADQFIGLGQSNTITGDFSAALDLAFLVRKGEIVGRVTNCMVTDNLFKLLEREFSLSTERERHGSMVVPYLFFPSVTFSC